MSEETVPVADETAVRIRQLATRTGKSAGEVVRAAIEAYQVKLFFAEMDDVYAVLEADFKEWGGYMADLDAWINGGELPATAPDPEP